ncbi:thiolase family protein [Paenisporosarcina cavernae]|uniref:Thiolase family protein n=1 Tax=Paenisporosarcina cavernae TaxID=2320858 RepID=A0A385YQC2_9BACL|nr:thiolase family protein [Paenisporosarcina cavernae]AYC28661.1 thiolase family protein [Paenisporosarcina cavernae]
MREVVIVDAARTAIGKRKGMLKEYRPDELLGNLLDQLVTRVGMEKGLVEDVIIGSVTQTAEQAGNIARTALLIGGFPVSVPGVTIDRQCGSSQQAVHFASQAILAGDMDVVIAGGVESMSRVTMFSNVGDTKPSDKLTAAYEIIHQGVSAERIAEKWNISREELDKFALASHQKALYAIQNGRFEREIIPVDVFTEEGTYRKFDTDEGPRVDASIEKLAELKTVFQEDGRITAGNASQMSDGASAVILAEKAYAEKMGWPIRAKIIARTVVGSDPTLMLTGPIDATKKVLAKAGMTLDQLDLYEVNEAFASVPLAWQKELSADPSKLNVNGGAIALGHPLGATGTKLLSTLLHELERTNKTYGLLAICEGMGMANATIIERV